MSLRQENQQDIIEKFAQLINTNNKGKDLEDIIHQLSLIPDAKSPIRVLAENNDPIIQDFARAAAVRADRDANAAVIKAREEFRTNGRRSQFSTNSLDYYPTCFMKLIKPIYENAVFGYARAGNVAAANTMLIGYERWLRRDISEDKRLLLEKIYKFAFQGYYQSENYLQIERLWMKRKVVSEKVGCENEETLFIVARSLARSGKFDAVAEFICKWSGFENNETSLSIIAAVNESYRASGHQFELQRLGATQVIMNEVNKACPSRDSHPRKEKIFELIMIETDIELKKSLLIDCLYQGTVLGSELWYKPKWLLKVFEVTPSIKRGVLEQIFKELIKMDVKVATLPGCEEYSANWAGLPIYPSKVHLFGLWPHSAPLSERSKVGMFAEENVSDTESSEESHIEATIVGLVRNKRGERELCILDKKEEREYRAHSVAMMGAGR